MSITISKLAPLRRAVSLGPALARCVLAVGFLAVAMSAPPTALAKEKQTMLQGVTACKAWCDKHRTGNEAQRCYEKCELYWSCNGKDSTKETCDLAKELLAERPGQSAPMPTPVLRFTGVETYQAGAATFVRYKLSVVNRANFDPVLFAPAPNLPPCGANTNAARAWVDIRDGRTRRVLYGFCALGSNGDLDRLWFAVERGKPAPRFAYITIRDRRTNQFVSSNVVQIFVPTRPTGVGAGTNGTVAPN